MLIYLCYTIKILWKYFSFNNVIQLALSNWKFPIYDAPARFVELSLGNFALIIMTFFWDRGDVGCYSMVVQFILLPISIIGAAMGNVFYRELSENIEDSKAVTTITIRAAKITFLLSFLPILFLIFGGDKILVMLLGKKWEVAGTMALCLCIYSIPTILSEPLLPIYRSLNRQEIRFRLNVLNFLLSLGSLYASASWFSNMYYAIIVHALFYALVRYKFYFSILQLANVRILTINRHFYIYSFSIYSLLAVRLILKLT